MPNAYTEELGDFLRARRARLCPADVGLEPGGRRKVQGLRREELALLAGLSTDYYQRMEQGRDVRPSEEVLEAIAGALNLDGEERRHLFKLARAARRPGPVRQRHAPERVPRSTRNLLQVMDTPALVVSRHLDVLAWNPLAVALLGEPELLPPNQRNLLIALFKDPSARERCGDWETFALDYIGMLRAAVAVDPTHPRAASIIGDLTIRSSTFRRLWSRHDVRESVTGSKVFHHPLVGDMTLDWDTYPLPGNPGPVMLVYTAEPGTPHADRLRLLGSLQATKAVRWVSEEPTHEPAEQAAASRPG
ncbi:helix-turn-helix transcriptional regulator [Actinoplanes sp. NPDC049596]|uniref:helix-turn-helix transcriptional regulator n=1 Tax=unclassified Actinoplanes TaxID=2626549 RepID=UPI0034341186